jgi:hypothetical protein
MLTGGGLGAVKDLQSRRGLLIDCFFWHGLALFLSLVSLFAYLALHIIV